MTSVARRLFSRGFPLQSSILSVAPSPIFSTDFRHIFIHPSCQSRSVQSPPSPPRHLPAGPFVDEAIPSNKIFLVGSDGKLGSPQQLDDVLDSMDRSQDFLCQVAQGAEHQRLPVCKILNKKTVRQQTRSREKEKAALSKKSNAKQMELNWAIDSHDLSHRLRQLSYFLGKGRRVEVVLVRKRKKRPPTDDEVNHLLDGVMRTIEEAGAAHVKASEGQPPNRVVMTVQKQ